MIDNTKTGNIILYSTEDGKIKINLQAIDGTVWLSQAQIVELFDSSKSNIAEHITNILKEELNERSTVRKIRTVATNGKQYLIKYYSLDIIMAVGLRVRSPIGTQFRKWANIVLKDYLVKGFAMDDDKLKDEDNLDYFDEWLEKIRAINASEKRLFQKVLDLYSTALDYDPKTKPAQEFFAKVQEKMLWAVTEQTSTELIADRLDPTKPNMGLQSWKGSIIGKRDIDKARNYLNAEELSELNQIITMYLDYAELQAKQRKTITMQQWTEKLDIFLTFNEQEILSNAETIKATVAQQIAHDLYEQFDTNRMPQQIQQGDNEEITEIDNLFKDIDGEIEN